MNPKYNKKKLIAIYLVFINVILFIGMFCNLSIIQAGNDFFRQTPQASGIWATLDLDPAGFNETRIAHNSLIIIQGRLYNRVTGDNKSGYTVALEIDDIILSSYTDLTINGLFQINYNIDPSLDIYTSHRIEATVIDPTPDTVEYRTYYTINVNTTSYFDISGPAPPQLLGDYLNPNTYLRIADGTALSFTSVNYQWYNGPVIIDNNYVSTDGLGLIQDILIPDSGIVDLDLLLRFESTPEIGYSETFITETGLFSNISCIWNLPETIRALSNLTIAGKLVSRADPSLALNNKIIQIIYNGTYISEVQTNDFGDFSINHPLSEWTGSTNITLIMPNTIGKTILTTYYINVQAPSNTINPATQFPPFLIFSSIFLPILGAVIGALAFYGYRYYKKQEKASKRIILPLEDKIKNLKILKDSGRLEESLSYLFNAIYMELIIAKYSRKRNENETIRDFAIVSVKDLKLSPSSIYPFIQKVEEVIYAKPFQINENDFYQTIELFSPIYFELTGFNFILNF